MNLKVFYKRFKEVALTHPLVEEVLIGDIYQLNYKTSKYPVICCGVNSVTRYSNYTNIQCYIYYADRLLEDHSNEVDVTTTAITTLQQIINALDINVLNIDVPYTTTIFQQKFTDECAGAYVQLSVNILDSVGGCTYED